MSYIRRGIGAYDSASNEPFFPFSPNKPANSGCGCGCSGGGAGMGLFDSMDPTTWGVGEYGTIAVAGYLAVKVLGDAKKVGGKAKRAAKSRAGAGGLGFVGALALAGGAYYLWSKSQSTTGVSGFGDYMAQGYTGPQLLQAPMSNADILIPAGW